MPFPRPVGEIRVRVHVRMCVHACLFVRGCGRAFACVFVCVRATEGRKRDQQACSVKREDGVTGQCPQPPLGGRHTSNSASTSPSALHVPDSLHRPKLSCTKASCNQNLRVRSRTCVRSHVVPQPLSREEGARARRSRSRPCARSQAVSYPTRGLCTRLQCFLGAPTCPRTHSERGWQTS